MQSVSGVCYFFLSVPDNYVAVLQAAVGNGAVRVRCAAAAGAEPS